MAVRAGLEIPGVTLGGVLGRGASSVVYLGTQERFGRNVAVKVLEMPQGTELAGRMFRSECRTLGRLASHPNIAGFKDSSANYVQFVKLLDALKSVPGFHLLQGKEPYLKDSLAAGASGFVVSLLHVDPRPFVALARAVRAGDTATADRLQAAILKVFDLINECFKQRPESSTLFHFLNEALSLRGVRVNLRLAYEADCPDLIAQRARAAVGVLAETC